jgi:hypothetical protein
LLSEAELQEQLGKTVTLYNRFHSPEATAKIVRVTLGLVTIAFSGSFCYSCGVMDLLDDFAGKFKVLADKAELKIDRTRQVNPRTFEADFKVKLR